MILDGIEAVIFDMDGTLTDSMGVWDEVDTGFFRSRNMPKPANLKKEIEGMSFEETAQYFIDTFHLSDTVEELCQKWLAEVEEKYATTTSLKPGVSEFIAYLYQQGIKIGIATSNSGQLVESFLKGRGLTKYFDAYTTCDDIGRSKPNPDVYLTTAKKLGVRPGRCLVFEDVPNGILAGKNAGMKVCAIEDSYSLQWTDKKKNLSDYYISDYRQLLNPFLPISRADMEARGIRQLDFVYIIGDAYVDHPSFGHAIISRLLEQHGYTVGIISQPDWKDKESVSILGEPKLGFIVTGGNMDSMVNHYSVSKRRREKDAYTPGGIMGKRPDYATIVYCNLIRQTYKKIPIIIGGIEASLRRLSHYDYWSNKVKRSILLDSGADLLLYGMGERSIIEMADGLSSGIDIKDLTYIDGSVYKTSDPDSVYDGLMLPDFASVKNDKTIYAQSFYTQYCNTDAFSAKRLIEPYDDHLYVVQNPPCKPLSTEEMDAVYELPFARTYHPSYEDLGGVPAISEVKFSLVSNRGCYGGCSFCALTFHQGRIIQTRSHESIIKEARQMMKEPDFKGYIHDVGGPTANFRAPACQKQLERGACVNKQCLFPQPCKNLVVDHHDYVELLRKLRALPGVKKVFIRSGIRFDYLIYDKDKTFFKELCSYHVSGQLKVAPEHISDAVLSKMGKPPVSVYNRFKEEFKKMNERIGKEQYLIPYLMSSHPGSTLKEAVELAEYLRDLGYMPEQVQDFYPTPGTISTCMFYTGIDPRDGSHVYVTQNPHEKAMQRALIQYRDTKNYDLVYEALLKAHRQDLIGYDRNCLIRPRNNHKGQTTANPGNEKRGSKYDQHSTKGQMKSYPSDRNKTSEHDSHGGKPKKKTIRNVHKKKQK